jgi:hypothetical protein
MSTIVQSNLCNLPSDCQICVITYLSIFPDQINLLTSCKTLHFVLRELSRMDGISLLSFLISILLILLNHICNWVNLSYFLFRMPNRNHFAKILNILKLNDAIQRFYSLFSRELFVYLFPFSYGNLLHI